MKTKIRKMSKKSLAILLGVVMLITSIGLGSLITANATTYYLWLAKNGSGNWDGGYTCQGAMTALDGSSYYLGVTIPNNGNFGFAVSTSNSDMFEGLVSFSNTSNLSVDTTVFNNPYFQIVNHNGTNYETHFPTTNQKQSVSRTVYITVNPTAPSASFSTNVPAGGGGGGETPEPEPEPEPSAETEGSIGSAVPSGNLLRILNGTDVAFYIVSYKDDSNNKYALTRNSKTDVKEGTCINKNNGTEGIGWIQIAKTDRANYDYITNNKGNWAGEQNTDIHSATGGEYFRANSQATKTLSATTGQTTINNGGTGTTFYSVNKLNFGTTTSSTKMSYSSEDLKLYYYVKSGSTYYALTGLQGIAASADEQTFDLSLSGLAAGNYSLYTVAKSSAQDLYYILDTDNFTVSAPPKTVTDRKNLLIFNTATTDAIIRGWCWNGSGNNSVNVAFGDKKTYSSKSLTTYNNSTYGYSSAIGFTSGSAGGGWNADGQVTGDITDGSASDDGIRYYYNTNDTKSNGSWTAFAHVVDTIGLSASTIGVGSSVNITNDISGTLTETAQTGGTTTAKVYYYAVRKSDNAKTDIATANSVDDSFTQEFTPSEPGTYYIFGYVSDQWGFETIATNVVTLTVKPVYTITTNTTTDAKYGSISVSSASAIEGSEVAVTSNDKAGKLTSLVVTKNSDGSDVTSAVYDENEMKITMPAYNITVTAAYSLFSEDSDWYYNGYTTTDMMSTSDADGYAAKMTEAKANGYTYSYYQVTKRSGENQLFTVSHGSPAHSYGDYDYIYFHGGKDGSTDTNWYKDNDIGCWFEASDGKTIKAYAIMEYAGWSDGYKMWRARVPYGAKYVNFKDDHKTCTWEDIDLTEGYRDQACYWTNSSGSNGKQKVTDFVNPVPNGFHEYFYNMSSAYYDTTGHSFDSDGTSVSIGGGSHSIPNPTAAENYDNYYVLVLNPGGTYTVNGDTINVPSGDVPYIVYSSELPTGAITSVPVYAKDGSVSNESSETRSDLSIGQQIGKTDISGGGLSNLTSEKYYKKASVEVGTEITITTTITNSNVNTISSTAGSARNLYYVKGFSINGKCYEENEWNSSGVYTYKYTVSPTDKYLEITPIYFLRDDSETTIFYLDSFKSSLKDAGWGETLYAYPFYTDPDVSDDDVSGGYNAFGSYPGQPVINSGGKYYIQVPLAYYTTDENSHTKVCTVEGVVISNGYYDKVHHDKLGNFTGVKDHRQTYDFKDFYTIDKALNSDYIVYNFKYRTGEDNNNPSPVEKESRSDVTSTIPDSTSGYTGTHTSEFLKDTYGRYIDIFGNVLSPQPAATPSSGNYLSVYSIGYIENASGHYGTEWAVYNTSGNIIKYSNSDKSIIPSALYFSSSSDLSTYGLGDYVNMYNTLNSDSYKGKPVKICYEQEIKTEDGSAYRSDGVWQHFNDNDVINANIKIQYMASGSSVYVDDTMNYDSTNGYSYGTTTGAKAYFTNTDTNKAGNTYNGNYESGDTYSTSSKNFTFTAKSNGNYIFQGWYRVNTSGVETPISSSEDGYSSMSSIDTYIAKFKYITSGALNLSAAMDSAYTGLGTAKIGVQVINSSDEVVKTVSPGTESITLGPNYINSNSSYQIKVTLQTIASGDYRFGAFASTATGSLFGGSDNILTTINTNDTGARTFTFNVSDLYSGVTQQTLALAYTSTLDKGTAYKVEYNYTGLGGTTKSYWTNAYSFESISNGTDVTSLTVGNRGTTFQTWVRNHIPNVDNADYDQTWTINTLSYANNKISITATSTAKSTYKVVTNDGTDVTVNSSVDKNAYVTGTSTLTCPEATKSAFKYWSVTNLVKNGGNYEPGSNEFARCYTWDFQMRLTSDCYIQLVTASSGTPSAGISEPTYSREIITDGSGNTTDKVYADFIVSYMNENVTLEGNDDYTSGLILEFNQYVTASSDVQEFNSTNAVVSGFAANTALSNSTYQVEGQQGKNALAKFAIDNSNYNNFNRMDYRLGFNNGTSWINRVIKAYYFVRDNSGNVTLSDPVYFCLHETAVSVYDYNE